MPSSVLGGKVPFSFPYPNKSLFFSLLVSLSVLVLSITSPRDWANKLLEWLSVFIGYFRTQKGYECFDPTKRHYFTSVDVTFFETTPDFTSEMSSPLVLSPFDFIPLPMLSFPVNMITGTESLIGPKEI